MKMEEENKMLRCMLENIAKHPDTPPLIKAYARGELHNPNPLTERAPELTHDANHNTSMEPDASI